MKLTVLLPALTFAALTVDAIAQPPRRQLVDMPAVGPSA